MRPSAQQGVLLVYPHTSNWDFVLLGKLAKWALGVQGSFWGKGSLFGVPFVRALVVLAGGVPGGPACAPQGLVGQMVAHMRQEKAAAGRYFALALSPADNAQGASWLAHRLLTAWRCKRIAPVGLVRLDFAQRVD